MKSIEEISIKPELPELITCEVTKTQGLDLLGLRISAEARALQMLDGVTTITPLVRYLGLRCWLIQQYGKAGGLNSWSDFIDFACKIESAIILAHCLTNKDISGTVGSTKAKEIIQSFTGSLPLNRLTKIIATNMYAGPSHDLGLSSSDSNLPMVTAERGVPIANALGKSLDALEALTKITPNATPQQFSTRELKDLGKRFQFDSLQGEELELYLRFIIPEKPRTAELPRLGTYLTLLELSKELKRKPEEDDLFTAAAGCNLDCFSAILHPVLDGWAHFIVRDMLVNMHETVVSIVGQSLQKQVGGRSTKKQMLEDICTEEISVVYKRIGLGKLGLGSPICDLVKAFKKQVGKITNNKDPARWLGSLNELTLFDELKPKSRKSLPHESLVALLPIAWLLAVERVTEDTLLTTRNDSRDGFTRIGVMEVIYPVVSEWSKSKETIRSVISKLMIRSIDQHLRIAWSRLAREPWKDVAVIHKDGDEFVYVKEIYPGRATSRVSQAVNWLEQLGLIDEKGLTKAGDKILKQRLTVFIKCGGLPE